MSKSFWRAIWRTWYFLFVADEIRMRVLEAVDENTVRLVFSVPTFLVGLQGRIELRYTSDQQ